MTTPLLITTLLPLLKETPIPIETLRTLLRTYPFPKRSDEAFSHAIGTILANYKELDTETQLRIQILQLVYQQEVNN